MRPGVAPIDSFDVTEREKTDSAPTKDAGAALDVEGSGVQPPVSDRIRRAFWWLERFAPAIGSRWAVELWCTPPQVDASYARRVRSQTRLTQAEFAARIGVPIETVRNWEQGKRQPRGPARALLKLLDEAPEVAFSVLSRKLS